MASINSDYTQFVSLSSQLEGLEATLMRLKRPLAEAGERLGAVAGALTARRREVAQSQTAAEALVSKATALQSYLSARELLDACTASIGRAQAETQAGSAPNLQLSHARSLHRTGLQLCRCRRQLADTQTALGMRDGGNANNSSAAFSAVSPQPTGPGRGAGGSASADPRVVESVLLTAKELAAAEASLVPLVVAAIRERIARLGDSKTSKEAVTNSDDIFSDADDGDADADVDEDEALHLLLACLSLLGRSNEGHDAITSGCTRPLLASLFTPGRVDDGVRSSYRAFSRCCDEALAAVTKDNGPIARLLRACRGLPGYDLFSVCVWQPLVSVLSSSLPGYANPAQPAIFHANYTALSTLYVRLRVAAAGHVVVVATQTEDGCEGRSLTSLPASEALQSCPATASLRSSLAPKLQVYHALRTSDVTQRMDKACSGAGAGSSRVSIDLGLGTAAATIATSAGGTAPAAAVVRLAWSELLSGIPQSYLTTSVNGNASPWPPSPTLLLPPSATLWSCLTFLWSPSVLIPSLGQASLTSALACIGRYASWAVAGAAVGAGRHGMPDIIAAINAPSSASKQHAPANNSASLSLSPLPSAWLSALALPLPLSASQQQQPSATAAPAPAAPGASSSSSSPNSWPLAAAGPDASAWASATAGDVTTLDAHLAAAADACTLAALVEGALAPRVLTSLALAPGSAAAVAVTSLLATSAQQLRCLAAYHAAVARCLLSRSCSAPLASLRAVPATFRMTAKAAPAKPSPYAAGVWRPLRALLAMMTTTTMQQQTAAGNSNSNSSTAGPQLLTGLPAPLLRSLAHGVVADVSASLESSLTSVLDGLRHMEESLAWLKKTPGTAGGAPAPGLPSSGAASDSDKIGLQLWLDVRAVRKEAQELLLDSRLQQQEGPGTQQEGTAASSAEAVFAAATQRVAEFAKLAPPQMRD